MEGKVKCHVVGRILRRRVASNFFLNLGLFIYLQSVIEILSDLGFFQSRFNLNWLLKGKNFFEFGRSLLLRSLGKEVVLASGRGVISRFRLLIVNNLPFGV